MIILPLFNAFHIDSYWRRETAQYLWLASIKYFVVLKFYFPLIDKLIFSRQITVSDGMAESLTKCGLFYLLSLKHIKIPFA